MKERFIRGPAVAVLAISTNETIVPSESIAMRIQVGPAESTVTVHPVEGMTGRSWSAVGKDGCHRNYG